MTPEQVRKKVKALVLRSKKTVQNLFSGEWRTAFRGRGLEFRDLRSYVPGDDIRFIDWKVTARTGQPHIRNYSEERELTVLLLCDVSGSQLWGRKRALLEELFAVISLAAAQNGDKVGLWGFSRETEVFQAPAKGEIHWMRMLQSLTELSPRSNKTSLKFWLENLEQRFPRRMVVFLLSDFMDLGYESALKTSALHHDLTLLHLRDPLESQAFPSGVLKLEDSESGIGLVVNGDSYRKELNFALQAREALLTSISRKTGCGLLSLETGQDYFPALFRYFRLREEMHHG